MGAWKDSCRRTQATFLRKGFQTRNFDSAVERARSNDQELRAVLGAADLTMLGVGAIIGAGVFVLTGEAAKEFAGPSIILSYLFSSVTAVLLALSYIEFAVELPITGGAFNYVRLVQGEFLAWSWLPPSFHQISLIDGYRQAGSCLILEYSLGGAAVSKGFSGYLASLFGLGTSTFVASAWIFDLDILAFVLISCLTLLLYFGTKESAWFNFLVTLINLLVILFVLGAAVGKGDRNHFTPFIPLGTQNTFRAAAVVFFSYIGFDSLVTVSAEVKNPKRDLPIGVVGSILICAVLYMLMAAALIGLQEFEEIDTTAPFSEAFVSVGMRWAGRVVSLGALTGIVTSVLVGLLGQSRILIALGREKLLPAWMAAIDEKRGTPRNALLVNWIGGGVLALLFDIDLLSRAVSMGTLFVLGMVSLAAIQRMYTPKTATQLTPWPLMLRLSGLVLVSIVEGAAFAMEAHPAIYATAIGTPILSHPLQSVPAGVVFIVAFSFYLLPVEHVPLSFVTPLKPLTPCAAVLAAVHLMFSLGWEAHVLFIAWQVVGFLIYLFYGMYNTPEPERATPKQAEMQNVPQERQGTRLLTGIAETSDHALT